MQQEADGAESPAAETPSKRKHTDSGSDCTPARSKHGWVPPRASEASARTFLQHRRPCCAAGRPGRSNVTCATLSVQRAKSVCSDCARGHAKSVCSDCARGQGRGHDAHPVPCCCALSAHAVQVLPGQGRARPEACCCAPAGASGLSAAGDEGGGRARRQESQ